ncbi:MAG: alkaline phosphatase D family protein [Gammaproteobacteria bacterium]|nr:alkaline phosphatase D family protein [Gammaproteobacteria bacterium]
MKMYLYILVSVIVMLGGCRHDDDPVAIICGGNCFPNGVAAGDVDQSSVVLWSRAAFAGIVRFEYGTDPDFILDPDGVKEVEVTDTTIPAKVTVTGLSAGTQYYYRACRESCPSTFVLESEARGKFRTPYADGYHGLRFGVSSCWSGDMKPFVSISNVPRRDLDFFVALGDTVYADSPGDASRVTDTGGRAKTLEDFRRKNELGYSEVDSPNDNYFALARASTASYVNIDDHEVVNNFEGGAPPGSQTERVECKGSDLTNIIDDEADNLDESSPINFTPWDICFCDPGNDTNPYAPGDPQYDPGWVPNCDREYINETDLYKNAVQAWHEYNPIREERYGQTGDARTAGKHRLYRYRTFGKDAALFNLDLRSFRDEGSLLLASNVNRTMLGNAQLNALLGNLLNAEQNGIIWKFILIPEPIQHLGVLGAKDRFEGYNYERALILDYIETNCIDNVVFISGDIHANIVNNLTYETVLDSVIPGQRRFSTSWDISTGSAAYLKGPIGAKITGGKPGEGREQLDLDFELALDTQLSLLNRPWTGLDLEIFTPPFIPLQLENALVPAKLLSGRYVNGHSFGWTEFEINPVDHKLLVTTYGIDWYEPPLDDADVTDILNRRLFVENQFKVTPVFPAANGAECVIDKNCTSCRCSLLAGIGEEGLGQCIAKLTDGSTCVGDGQCESGRCTLLGPGLPKCQEKVPDNGICLNDIDCDSGICSGFRCVASLTDRPDGAGCTLDGHCESRRCSDFKCKAKLSNGNDCRNDNDCLSDRCSGFVCKAKKSPGSSCLFDNECRSNKCSGIPGFKKCE